jgi:hypothetical protein
VPTSNATVPRTVSRNERANLDAWTSSFPAVVATIVRSGSGHDKRFGKFTGARTERIAVEALSGERIDELF